eukprot:Seg250.9 transcript_id=Seg250.9/GoldUCD/mRNA.D3Y31 product="Histone H2B.1/H2B.2" protein_id=Seg250.9/GoldUCD/D3Y31
MFAPFTFSLNFTVSVNVTSFKISDAPARRRKVKAAGDMWSYKKEKKCYFRQIYKALKQINPNSEVSSEAMSIMNFLMNNIIEWFPQEESNGSQEIFQEIAQRASCLAGYNKDWITAKEIRTAIRLHLPWAFNIDES